MHSKDDRLRRLVSEQAAEWYAAQAEGPLGREQAGEFMRWLQLSPLHVAEYLRIAELARGLQDAARDDATPLDALLADADEPPEPLVAGGTRWPGRGAAVAAERDRVRPRVTRPGTRKARRLAALAAVLLVGAVVALASWLWLAAGITTTTLATARGEERTVYLPDHTLLRLDAESRVVARFSRSGREVTLERGQVYFDVADDPRRPFRVRVGAITIRDIGTEFDVYRRAAGATVTVLHGHVQVWNTPRRAGRAGRDTLLARLEPDQRVKVSGSGRVLAYGRADVWQALAWMHGRITFEDTPISEVASQFNRHNAAQITLADPSIGATRITGTFQSHNVQDFVRFLEGLPGVEVSERGGRIEVRSAPPAS